MNESEPGDGGPDPLSPPRVTDGVVTLRPAEERDIPALVRACADPEIPRWTRVPSPYTVEDARRYLAVAATEAASGSGVALAVTDERDELIGTVGMFDIDRARRYGEIGYWTAAPARRRGVTVRAVVLLRDWAAEDLGLTELEILAHRDNLGSQRVAERAGFTFTGEIAPLPRMPPGRRDGYKVFAWRAA